MYRIGKTDSMHPRPEYIQQEGMAAKMVWVEEIRAYWD
jgi:hypothetical protein